ncbi:nitrilase-related carbon-nitrogen hydrolase [Sulfurimonas sp. HSL-1656]|uniref:nitrilase-related carbon-nitrogen hydrolase n=1 Tax=Thiomicrolovo subterrani TaxID=3131934 RepID=UPI0031FA0F2A
MTVTLVQNAPRLNRTNLESCETLAAAYAGRNDVIVFPELALNGYLLQDKVYEDAWTLPELEPLAKASLACDIVVGAALKENGRTYNTACYFSGGELRHVHRKLHLPNYGMFEEARYFFKGNRIEAFDTAFGRSVMLVCEDLWRAQTMADVAALKPEFVYVIANSPARGFEEEGLAIEGQWDALLKSLAQLANAYVVFVNRVGFEDGLGFWGGSRVITPRGGIERRLPLFDEAVETVTPDHRLHDVEKWLAKID